MNEPLYAGIELGGTKTICLIGTGVDTIRDQLQIPTTNPADTLGQIHTFLASQGELAGIGIGAFGPVNIDPESANYGCVESTPKPGWSHTPVVPFFRERFSCPINLDTDVNAAAIAEHQRGNGKGLRNFIYITVGTGIGGGALIEGAPVRGNSHPEMGHIALPRHMADETFLSACPYHQNCAEGLASGSALRKRWGMPLNEFPPEHPAWDMQASYLAEFFHSLTLLFSPQRIIVGGGVSSEQLLARVRTALHKKLNGYVDALKLEASLESYLCLPELAGNAGPLGSLLLAYPEYRRH